MEENDIVGLVIDGKYKLDRKIGEGGMGAVYLGTQLMVDRHVAIKLLHAGLNSHERIKQRFEVEAKAIGRLHHPNCITLFDFGYSRELDAFFTVMEYLAGDPMHKRVVHGVPQEDARSIAKQIALALDHAHHQGILHRDLKPENIILAHMTDGSELVKVLDFGIARIFQNDDVDAETQNRLTQAGEVFGTPAYISPEQARGERDLTPSSDLYSLGIMLFEMLEGRLPFWGDTAIDTIMKHMTEPVPPITRLDVSNDLKQLTYKLMSKDPELRFQSGKELAKALESINLKAPHHMHTMRTAPPLGAPPTSAQAPPDLSSDELDEWESANRTVVAPALFSSSSGALTHRSLPSEMITNELPPPHLIPPPEARRYQTLITTPDKHEHKQKNKHMDVALDSFEGAIPKRSYIPFLIIFLVCSTGGIGVFLYFELNKVPEQKALKEDRIPIANSAPADAVDAVDADQTNKSATPKDLGTTGLEPTYTAKPPPVKPIKKIVKQRKKVKKSTRSKKVPKAKKPLRKKTPRSIHKLHLEDSEKNEPKKHDVEF